MEPAHNNIIRESGNLKQARQKFAMNVDLLRLALATPSYVVTSLAQGKAIVKSFFKEEYPRE